MTRTITLVDMDNQFLDVVCCQWQDTHPDKSITSDIIDGVHSAMKDAISYLTLWAHGSLNKTKVRVVGILEGYDKGHISAMYFDDAGNVKYEMMGILGTKRDEETLTFNFHS